MSEPEPEATPLVVSVASIARRLRLDVPLDPDDEAVLEDAIRDATADVEAYLGRSLTPVEVVETGHWPWWEGWRLRGDDFIEIVSAVPETYTDGSVVGTYTITYMAGLDARTAPALEPIRRYIRAAVMNAPDVLRLWQATTGARGNVTSLSTDGQAVTFAAATHGGGGAAGTGSPGALPDRSSLWPWRKQTVYQRPTTYYDGALPGWW